MIRNGFGGMFRLALAQVNGTVGDLRGNTRLVIEYIEQAREMGADLVAFPELILTGYPPEDLLLKGAFIKENLRSMHEVVASSQDIAVVLGFVDERRGKIYNAAAVASDGELAGVYHKLYLPNYGVFDEERYFKSGRACPVFTIAGVKVGVNICEDIWHVLGPIVGQRRAGAELIVNINGSPFHLGKGRLREEMLVTRASNNGVFVAYVNTVGGQDELVFDGGSMVLGPGGEVLARGVQFEEELLLADLDIGSIPQCRMSAESSRKVAAETRLGSRQTPHVFVSEPTHKQRLPLPKRDEISLDELGEVYCALVLGTRDYVWKSGFSKVLIGLSGGIDSSLTCCVAVEALGKDNVLGVAMPSRYSSDSSIADACSIAERLGVELQVIPIELAHAAFEEMLEPFFRDSLPNVAEENIQARIRGNLLMAIANKFDRMVLATGNKSELAVGYTTLYGDMSGGFAVLKDVPKTLVYRLAKWRNDNLAPHDVIPSTVLQKAPSPELKYDQITEEERISYKIMDPVLKAYVEEDRSFEEILADGVDGAQARKVMCWVDRNEYKRRQAAPGVKITPRAFGRDRRMPIVNRYLGF